jgi:hypothetical protein
VRLRTLSNPPRVVVMRIGLPDRNCAATLATGSGENQAVPDAREYAQRATVR